jgi:hypothetical protein
MSDALLGIFENQNALQSQTLLDVNAKYFTLSSTPEDLKSGLVAKGINEEIAAQVSQKIATKQDKLFRTSGFVSKEVSVGVFHSVLCIYKISSGESRDLLCLTAEVKFEGALVEKLTLIKASILAAVKKVIANLPANIRKYHSFTKLSLLQFFRLKSAQTQAELDRMLRDAVGTKDQVVYELNQKRGDPFLAKLFKNGITSYTSSAIVESLEGVELDMLNDYSVYLADKMSIPAHARPTFMDQLYLSSITDKNEWKEFEFLYKLNAGTAKYVSVMSVLDSNTNTLDFLNSDIKAGFELGPDVIISTRRRSSFFGLFSSTSIQITYRPAELTMQSIELLFKFFKVAAFEKFRAFRHI